MEHRATETEQSGKRMRCFDFEMPQLKSWFRLGWITWETLTALVLGGTREDEHKSGSGG